MYRTGIVYVLYRYCTGIVQVLYRYRIGIVNALHRYRICIVQISLHHIVIVQVSYKCRIGIIQVFSRYHIGIVQSTGIYCISMVQVLYWCRIDFYKYSQLRVSRTVLESTHFPVFVILIMNHPPRNVKFPFVSSQRFPSTRVIKTSTAQKRTQETRYNDCKAFPKPLTQNLISVFVSRLSSQYNVDGLTVEQKSSWSSIVFAAYQFLLSIYKPYLAKMIP